MRHSSQGHSAITALSTITLSVAMLSVIYSQCRKYARNAEYCYAEYLYEECLYADCHYDGCRYAGCRYAECHGQIQL
jgi:hypothetical protein